MPRCKFVPSEVRRRYYLSSSASARSYPSAAFLTPRDWVPPKQVRTSSDRKHPVLWISFASNKTCVARAAQGQAHRVLWFCFAPPITPNFWSGWEAMTIFSKPTPDGASSASGEAHLHRKECKCCKHRRPLTDFKSKSMFSKRQGKRK